MTTMTDATPTAAETIKMGRPGKVRRVAKTTWSGTAEVSLYHTERVPACLVVADNGETMALVRLAGNDFDRDRWWDACCVSSREWEDHDGQSIADVDPDRAAEIDTILATATSRHEQSRRELHDRVQQGLYSIA